MILILYERVNYTLTLEPRGSARTMAHMTYDQRSTFPVIPLRLCGLCRMPGHRRETCARRSRQAAGAPPKGPAWRLALIRARAAR